MDLFMTTHLKDSTKHSNNYSYSFEFSDFLSVHSSIFIYRSNQVKTSTPDPRVGLMKWLVRVNELVSTNSVSWRASASQAVWRHTSLHSLPFKPAAAFLCRGGKSATQWQRKHVSTLAQRRISWDTFTCLSWCAILPYAPVNHTVIHLQWETKPQRFSFY